MREMVVDLDDKQLMKLKDVLEKTLSNLKIESQCSNQGKTIMLGVRSEFSKKLLKMLEVRKTSQGCVKIGKGA